jgi:hypothetical protein
MADISDVSLQASALAFTIYTLAKHPEKTEKLIQVRSRQPSLLFLPCPSPILHVLTNLEASVCADALAPCRASLWRWLRSYLGHLATRLETCPLQVVVIYAGDLATSACNFVHIL